MGYNEQRATWNVRKDSWQLLVSIDTRRPLHLHVEARSSKPKWRRASIVLGVDGSGVGV